MTFPSNPFSSEKWRPSARWLRIALPGALIFAQTGTFLWIYSTALGGFTAPLVPHLTLAVLLVASIYLVGTIVATRSSRTLRILSWISLSAAGTLATTLFYLVASFTLFGFRDLPTREVISGYFTQIPAMTAALPVSGIILALSGITLTCLIFGITAANAWGLAGLRKHPPPGINRAPIRPAIALTPLVAFLFLILLPPPGFLDSFEPWLRSLYSRPLAESGLGLQSNPVEEAQDHKIERAYPKDPMGTRNNVILIYIDGLRSDVLEPYGSRIPNMPFLQKLVSRGEVQQFPRVFSSCSMTLCGLGTLLQSRPAHRVSPGNLSLPKILHRQGYETRYLLSGDHRHFLALRKYYEPSDFYLDGSNLPPSEANDDLAIFNQLNHLPKAEEVHKPQFLMLGLMSVHIWGTRHDSFRKWRPDKLRTIDFSGIDGNSIEAYRNNYMNGVLQADHVIEKIWSWLDQSGYLKNSIVIITSDHGDSLGEHGHLGHARSLYTPELLIPLWLYTPKRKFPIRNPTFQDDIAPTILDFLNLPVPASWTGHSLMKPAPTSRWFPLYYINSRDKFGIIFLHDGKTLKYLVDKSSNKESIFNLDNDLFEKHDIIATTPKSEIATFRAELQSSFGTLLTPN